MDPATDCVASEGGISIELDGSNDYVRVGGSTPPAYFKVPSVTVSVWVQFANSTGDKYVFDYEDNTSKGGYYMHRNSNTLGAGIGDGVGFGEISGTIPGMPDYVRWYHCAYTVSASECVLYVDGRPIATGAGRTGVASTRSMVWGMFNGGGFNIAARIDDMRIYDRGLSASTVKTLALRRGIAYETTRSHSRRISAAPTFKAAWLNQRSQIIGGGVR